MNDHAPGRWRRLDTWIVAVVVVAGLGAAVAEYERQRIEAPMTEKTPTNPPPAWEQLPKRVRILWQLTDRVVEGLQGFLAVVSLGLLGVTLRPGRIRGRGGWPGPGVAAILGVSVPVMLGVLLGVLDLNLTPPPPPGKWAWTDYRFARLMMGVDPDVNPPGAVLGAWTVLAVAGRWKRRDDWPDRLGRWVGWAWITCSLYQHLVWDIHWG